MTLGPWLAALAFAVSAQQPIPSQDALGVYDGQGHFYAVTTRYGGAYHYIHVLKLNAQGGVVWQQIYNPASEVRATAITLDPNLNLVVAGTSGHGTHFDPILLKYASVGSLLGWETYEAGTTMIPGGVTVDLSGYIYLAGTYADGDGSSVRLIKYGPRGGVYWAQVYHQGQHNYLRGLSADVAGNISMTVESRQGGPYGTFQVRIAVYHPNGALMSLR